MMITQVNTTPFLFQNLGGPQDIEHVSQQFEALLFRQFLGKALKPMVKSKLLSESNATDTYRSFLVDGLSQAIASTHPLQIQQLLRSANYEK